MPRRSPPPEVNPVALNALTDLYYCFKNMAIQAAVGNESIESFDRFYISELQYKIEEYYHASNLDPVKLGEPGEATTLKALLPVKNFSQISAATLEDIKFHAGSLKTYNDLHKGVGNTVPEDVHALLNKAQNLMSIRESKQRSAAVFAMPNLAYATVLYENSAIHIDSVILNLDRNSNQDLVAKYLFSRALRQQIEVGVVTSMLQEERMIARDSVNSRAVKTACDGINHLVKKGINTDLDLIDTSIDNKVIRMY